MNLIDNHKPNHFTRVIEVFYMGTYALNNQAHFDADESTYDTLEDSNRDVYHVFNFEFGSSKYEFKVTKNGGLRPYNVEKSYTALLHRKDNDACWFEGEEQFVYLWEPDLAIA